MTTIFVDTKEEAKEKRREMNTRTHEAHYAKLLFDRGYVVYSYPRGLLTKKVGEEQ